MQSWLAEGITVTENFSALDILGQITAQKDIRIDTTVAIPLRSGDVDIGEMFVSPTAWGDKELVAISVAEQNRRDILVISVPPSPVPFVDAQTAARSTWLIRSINAAGAILAAAITVVTMSAASPLGAILAGMVAGAYTEREMRVNITPRVVPKLVEHSGHVRETFYSTANWLGLFSVVGKNIYVLGTFAFGQPRGEILYDKRHWKGGVYISGEVEPCLPEIQAFCRRLSVPFICHSPRTGEVWYVDTNAIRKSFGHRFGGKRVIAIKVTEGKNDSANRNSSLSGN